MRLYSYAKINLSLDVLGKREDGYHEVATIMQQISLSDDIDIDWQEGGSDKLNIELTTNKHYLPVDEKNLAYKAALLMNEFADKRGHLKIDIHKRIPVAAGLAGGSGNAAAVLIGLNRLWHMGYDTGTICEVSRKLGSDIPFMVLVQNSRYTCALGTGTGDELKPIRRDLDKFFVLVKPRFGVSTPEVYKGIDSISELSHPDTYGLEAALLAQDSGQAIKCMGNVLEAYTLKAYPQVEEIKKMIMETPGVRFAMMSGSGPTVIGFYDNMHDARNATYIMRQKGYESYHASTIRRIRGKK